ncbi:TIMELESS-interacting protein-like [Paramacrobiotus metropolitanus]|uniref:TIMELESS-interacting protein-like n=1 Tax=Paramacrobiotus metropolitanus TaxID=2943436 RepID=UPI002445B68D|nr:TIMELESS-interacting protein-like [Paramacrobiotus metropolitanus]
MPKHDSISLADYDLESGEEDYAFANYDNDRFADEMDELERERDGEASTAKDAAAKTVDRKDGKTEEAAEKKPKRVMGPPVKLDPVWTAGTAGAGEGFREHQVASQRMRRASKENLQILMRKMEAWAHSMYPKARFDDTLEKIKHIGSKAKVKAGSGLPVLPEDCVGADLIETDTPSKNTGNVAANPRISNNAKDEDFAWFEQMMADSDALAQAQMLSSLPLVIVSATTRDRSRSLSPVVVNHYSNSNPELKGQPALNKQNNNYGSEKAPLLL